MHPTPSAIETSEQILREREPNFLRLYLNPHVAQACFCLDRYVRTTWTSPGPSGAEDCQTFLANSLEEALSGSIKLARYNRPTAGRGSSGLLLDPADRLAGFVSARLANGGEVSFLPGLRVIGRDELAGEKVEFEKAPGDAKLNPLVLVSGDEALLDGHAEAIRSIVRRHAPLVIACVDREGLDGLRAGRGGLLGEVVPDIVVFDESFAGHAVPFGAFTARKALFAPWNKPGKATFHSTTFQPNTISTRHFLRRLAEADPDFLARYRDELQAGLTDLGRLGDWFRRYYNPALFRLIRASGFNTLDVRAAGSFFIADGRPIYDTVGGVACSIRGHNPPTYVDELRGLETAGPVREQLRRRLEALTGLECLAPAVSGASAVENAIKLALVARFPRRHILALKAGFGGKTLLALTGTANPSYKEHIGPLHAEVHYVDPFAPDAREQVDALLAEHEFAVVQLELIQSVGGVRMIPESLVRHLDERRGSSGYLLLVDEVQTGMYRTGPFTLSRSLGLMPDLLLLGKGTSDMMFPFALTLYSARVRGMLEAQGSDLADSIERRHGYEQGYQTVLNVLRLGEESDLPGRVSEAASRFRRSLTGGLAPCENVREVRVFGLLIGIELDTSRWPNRWLGKRLSVLYLLCMLRHAKFPVLAGFCQYERNVLKITPPLNTGHDEIEDACATIVEVLRRPLHRVLASVLVSLIRSPHPRKESHEHGNDPALELVSR
jgi:acetylornithine/succinyldiaminopimelate/putrescine aminotransferase